MTAQPSTRASAGPLVSTKALTRWATRLAVGAPLSIGMALSLFGTAEAMGGAGATSDNWVGALVGFGLVAGLLASVVGFAFAVAAKTRHEPWLLLWLPLSMLPATLAFFVLGEAFWWE